MEKFKQGYIIGFGGKYYTLWRKGLPRDTFVKNISKDLDKAMELYPEAEVDESLKGTVWSINTDIMPFGKYKGSSISEMIKNDDFKQLSYLKWISENMQLKGSLKAQLNNSKELIDSKIEKLKEEREKAYEKKQQQIELSKKLQSNSGYYFSEKERVELVLKLVNEKHFETAFGIMTLQTFVDLEGRTFYHTGSTILHKTAKGYVSIKATIKHKEYKGQKQTHIQRISYSQVKKQMLFSYLSIKFCLGVEGASPKPENITY